MRTAIVILVGLILATVASALLGIWLDDGRWGWTAAVLLFLTLATACVIAALLDEADRR